MARYTRIGLPDIPQHIIQRGNNRQPCFHHDQDYAVYLDKLREYASQFKVAIHAYVLMTNHVHLLATPNTETGISQTMQSLGRYYVRYFNKRHRRSGTLWEGRFKAAVIDSDRYFLTVSRYIELNPVRAKMVDHPADYTWSSYHFNALLTPIKLITPHPLYLGLGETPTTRAKHYSSLFESEIPDFKLEEIRGAINSTRVLGGEVFKRQLEKQTGLSLIPNQWGGVRR
jgi:REP-associated tyrosine transposase